ncbi:MAG TPA: glycosyltransferase [Euzebyales bacterium]|nr:glycosyltransferase [Euzebyales bacterium]
MRIVMVTVGSRGDVQPCVAFARGLGAAGFTVRLAAPAPFADLVTAHGVPFAPLPIDPSGMLAGDVGRAWVESGRNPVAFVRGIGDLGDTLGERLADAVLDVCADADAVVYTTLAFPAWHVARAAGVPAIQVGLAPLSPTVEFPPMLLPAPFAGRDPWRPTPAAALARGYHRAGHQVFAQMLWLAVRRRVNAWRRQRLRAPAIGWRSPALQVDRAREPLLHAYSPTVLPPPQDWGAHIVTTGYWFLDSSAGARLPVDVEAFLAAGPPPVSIGMGSMTGRDPAQVTRVAVEALRRTGQRGLLLAGWGGIGDAVREAAPGDVDLLVVDEIPHDLLMPRVRAAVHHGGAGTTGATLRAGVPTVVVPHFGDQSLWGDRVHALGAGPAPVPRRALTPRRLAHAVSAAVHDTRIRDQAARLGGVIRAEQGVARAVAAVTRMLDGVSAPAGRRGS